MNDVDQRIGLPTEERIGRLSKYMILHMSDVPGKVMLYTEFEQIRVTWEEGIKCTP